ncbi:hypothetical protein E3P99_02251 [Wallemia hederae]|uniref:Eukaryotic translation initiation factor 3 subunit D n=1 Tax=Wallemia hederae TaxID=1540922 RepID=A0A4T0FKV1_9BASI|nr:hypothetical protein E3P99_02251 [Wallemia hederae]
MDFKLPNLGDSGSHFGPPLNNKSNTFNEIPFSPYSKFDKITQIADFNNDIKDEQSKQTSKQLKPLQKSIYGSGSATAFGYIHGEDEASFSLVDNRTSAKRTVALGKRQQSRTQASRPTATRTNTAQRQQPQQTQQKQQPRTHRKMGWKDWDKPNRIRDASVQVEPEWEKLAEIDFPRLNKLNLEVNEGEDVETYGQLYPYDRAIDRITTKNEKPLEIKDRTRYNPTTSVDPVIKKLAQENKAEVFATDCVLSVLMTSARSVYPWDLVVVRKGNQIFLDKREGGPFDFVSVNENATDPPMENDKETLNTPASLSFEATYVNHNYTTQVTNEEGKPQVLGGANPFYSGDEPDPLAKNVYKYRKFDLSIDESEKMDLIVRTELDAYIPNLKKKDPTPTPHITVRALNEFDHRAQGSGGALDWRAKLDTQRGAVVATELKNNSVKLARWAVQSILAGADQMKFGFISRANPRDESKHVIVGVQSYKPKDLASQLHITLSNGFGVVRTIVDLVKNQPEGKYILIKDPNRSIVRLYSVPANFGEAEDDDQVKEGAAAGAN